MHLHRCVAPAVALVLGLAACEDSKQQPAAAAPTAPAAQSMLVPDDAPNAALALEKSIVSVCKAYRKAGAKLQRELRKSPEDADLLAQAKTLKEMTDDACN
jgi:hypothetical protein